MKKIIIFWIVSSILLSVPMTIFAESDKMETVLSDSVNISDEIKQILEVQPYLDTVYKFYNIDLNRAFVKADNIDAVFEQGSYVFGEYYVVQTIDNKFISNGIVDNTVFYSTESDVLIDPNALRELQEGKAILQLSPDVEIYARYYLTGETSHYGSAVYYKTNKGDYVYYRDYRVYDHDRERYETENFLFTIKEFCELQRTIYDKRREEAKRNPYADGGVGSENNQQLTDIEEHSQSDDDLDTSGLSIESIESDNANISNESYYVSDTLESYIESVVSDNSSVSNESEPIRESNGKTGMWIAISCGALLLVGIVLVVLRKNKVKVNR